MSCCYHLLLGLDVLHFTRPPYPSALIIMQGMVQPQLLGLALTYVMSIMGVMQWFVRQTAEVSVDLGVTQWEAMSGAYNKVWGDECTAA